MNSSVKYFIYVAASVFIFILLTKSVYNDGIETNKASAFDWEKEVDVYFVDLKKAETVSCVADTVVKRTVLNAETLGLGALEALLKGPTAEEGQVFSAISKDALIQKFEVKNGVALVDFNSALGVGSAGSCNVTAIRSQIENTLIALPDIDSVVISINGETEGILEP